VEESLREVQSRKEFIEIVPSSQVTVDLRYATTNNFTGTSVYGVFDKAFLHEKAAEKFFKALDYLVQSYPGYKLILFDALRPRSVQYKLWEHVIGTEQEKYVADPKAGSMHNYGFAVDLSVLDDQGDELDMGTAFDEFKELSQPQLEAQFLKEGKITQRHVDNRMILRDAMTKAGFIQLPHEWWHFDALPKSDVKTLYKIVE
jgi:D-alanyl-D-alanine dipeptidase